MKPKPRHLLIDGYNVIHAWPELRELLDFDIDTACKHLANTAQIIHDFENIRTTLVFDGKGPKINIERPSKDLSFSLLYTPSNLTADEFIEQFVKNGVKKQSFIVVSRDNLLVETTSALGATTMNPDNFKSWINQCQQLQSEKLKRHSKNIRKEWKLNNPWEKLQ